MGFTIRSARMRMHENSSLRVRSFVISCVVTRVPNELTEVLTQQGFDEGVPFGFEGGAAVLAAGLGVPVIGVPLLAFLAMQIGVDGHGVGRLYVIDAVMSARPVAFAVPPESDKRGSEAGGWRVVGE